MKYILLIIIILSLSSTIKAQKNNTLIIDSIFIENTNFKVLVRTNIVQDTVVLYKPELEDVCYGILIITAVNQDSGIYHRFYDCKFNISLESLNLTHHNSILLTKGEYFGKEYSFSIKNFSPFLERNSNYLLKIKFNYSIINFEGSNSRLVNKSNWESLEYFFSFK